MLQVDDSVGLAPWGPLECTEELEIFMKCVNVAEDPWAGGDGDSFVTLCPSWNNGHEDGGDKEAVV